jgi:predicted naringenin-chalcone synthase
MTSIMAVRSAFPVHRYPQAEFTSKVAELSGLDPGEGALLKRLHGNCGVDYRHIVLPFVLGVCVASPGQDHRHESAAGIGRPHDRAGSRGERRAGAVAMVTGRPMGGTW